MDVWGVAGRGHFGQASQRPTRQFHRRLAAGQVGDPHVSPKHPSFQSCTECLGGRLLSREAFGVSGRALLWAPLCTIALKLCINAVREALAEAPQSALDAPDVDGVDAGSQDHPPALAASMRRRISATAGARPTKIASPTRKWPILSSRTCRIAAIGATVS